MRSETFSVAWRAAVVGVLLLALGLPAYTQVGGAVGGVPSRLRVQSLGVNTPPPAGNGSLAVASSLLPDVDNGATLGSSSERFSTVFAGALCDGACANGGIVGSSGTTLNIGAGSDWASVTIDGVASSDFARLSQSNTLTSSGAAPSTAAVNISSASPWVRWNETDQGVDAKVWMAGASGGLWVLGLDADGGGTLTSTPILVSRSGTTVTSIALAATAISANGVDMTPSSGTFTANWTDGCSTTPTQSVRWYKIGDVVTLTAAAATGTCTGDTTIFNTSVDLPAAIRPTNSNAYGPHVGGNNNGTSVTAMLEVSTSGQLVANRCGAVTGTCDGGTWTNSGNRALDAWTITYVR